MMYEPTESSAVTTMARVSIDGPLLFVFETAA
jgi:hypothetical protein